MQSRICIVNLIAIKDYSYHIKIKSNMNIESNNRIRVCYFIGSLKIGGAQKHLVELINSLDRNKFDIYLVTGEERVGFGEQLDLDSSHLLCLGLDKYYDFNGIISLFTLIAFLKKNKINILHSYLFECNVYSAVVKIFRPTTKFIMSIRNMNYTHGPKKILLTRFASMIANYVTVVCDKVGEFVVNREKINPGKIVTLYNAVDNDIFYLHSKVHDNAENENNIIITCVASLNYRKGQEYLIKAIHSLIKRGRKIHLWLLGDGKNRDTLVKLTKELGLSGHVTFYGYVKNVREILTNVDIGVLSSFEEGMSNALLEYMAMGIPAVTTDVGGNREVNLDGVTGYVIPPRDIESLADALDKLVSNSNLRYEMGVKGRQRIKDEFSINNMKDKYTSFYLDTVMKGRLDDKS